MSNDTFHHPVRATPGFHLVEAARELRHASRKLAYQSTDKKNNALQCMAQSLRDHQESILRANHDDLINARAKGLDDAFINRLELGVTGIENMASALEELTRLADPVGSTDQIWMRPNGLQVGKRRIPLGVIGIIYESRPNVTSDAAGLCLKSGNGVLLKGGSDAFFSNRAVYHALCKGLQASTLDPVAQKAIGFVDSTERDLVREMLQLDRFIDVIIPRGGKGLIEFVKNHTRIPLIKHDEGVCHLVVDACAPSQQVDAIVLNAKTQRPGVCNAIETLLVLESAVDAHLKRMLTKLVQAGVKLHLCERALQVAGELDLPDDTYSPASEQDYFTEYLALELAVRVVHDLDAAIEHISQYGSRHTESLLSQNYAHTQQFIEQVDSSVVMINASTRFSDGNQLGLGAEIGISTTKMHAYGPMGLRELTTTKFVVLGNGQIRQ